MIVVNKISVVVERLVGAVVVYLRAIACGVNLGNRQLHRQGVDSVRQRGVVAVR